MTNSFQSNIKGKGNQELSLILALKNADQSLKRIMKITFFLGMFYFGNPLISYLMFKGKNALEVSYIQQLGVFSYANVMFIPVSLLISALQQYYRFKYFALILLYFSYLFYIYKELYEMRKKYFDFAANK